MMNVESFCVKQTKGIRRTFLKGKESFESRKVHSVFVILGQFLDKRQKTLELEIRDTQKFEGGTKTYVLTRFLHNTPL